MRRKPKSWKVPKENWEMVRNFLISEGGLQDAEVKGIKEVWRIRIKGGIFTLYENGTLFSTGSLNEEMVKLYDQISKIVGEHIEEPEKDFLIGLDETGKGEVLGHSILVGVILPKNLLKTVEQLIGVADTKKKKSVSYWDNLFLEIDRLRKFGLNFIIEKIPPWHVDRFNLNKIMDVIYQRILSQLTREISLDNCRIILDDYGFGINLRKYMDFLHANGAEIRVESKADEKYREVKLASVIAKREREKVMEAINKSYSFPNCPVGSGNAGDPQTLAWLKKWKESGKDWPWFVKKSFVTIRELDGKVEKVEKVDPPIRHDLLSTESRSLFDEGKLSTHSLKILCPRCGETMRSCKVTPFESERLVARCINCNEIIPDLNTTLLYYCGYIIPDSSVILSGIISKDMERGRFFEGFTFLIHPIVKNECDSKGGRKELGRLAHFSSIGRINLLELNESVYKEFFPDEIIVNSARRNNAIIYTRDKGMYESVIAKGMFCLTK